jgi:hypothetical protein
LAFFELVDAHVQHVAGLDVAHGCKPFRHAHRLEAEEDDRAATVGEDIADVHEPQSGEISVTQGGSPYPPTQIPR